MSITAAAAPVRVRHNRFTIFHVHFSADAMTALVRVDDENGEKVSVQPLAHTGERWQALAYLPNGDLQVTTEDAPAGSLLADFNAFVSTAGAFLMKANALEARLQSTGRLGRLPA